MRWDAYEIARFARGAGFTGDDVTTATALALATSGGVATYDYAAHAPGTGHWVGLWGVDIDRYPQYAGTDLHVPTVAAWAAYDLNETVGRWSWSPVWLAGTHEQHRAEAGTARTREYEHQRPVLPFTFHHTATEIAHATDRLARLRHTLNTFDRQGR